MKEATKRIAACAAVTLLGFTSSLWAQEGPRVRPETRFPTFVEKVDTSCADNLATQLQAAAEARGISIQTEQMLTISRPDATFVSASVTGFEDVPATELPNGVDFGFAYLDAPGSGLPAGYYTLRANAVDVRLGQFDATVQLIDDDGNVAAELAGVVDAFSLDVPEPRPFAQTVVGGGVRLPDPTSDRIIWISGWYFCPNGWVICFDIIIITRDHSEF